jgi:hypothetical protein
MMPNEFRQIVPLPQPEIEATFAAYQATSQFYREVQTREALSLYCDWYYKTSARHRQELQQMRSELNILSWFRRGRHKR